MQRRSFLSLSAAFIANPKLDLNHYGYIPGSYAAPSFYTVSKLEGFGAKKHAFLCNAYKRITGRNWPTRDQFRGDCAGVAVTTAIDFTTITQTMQKRSCWKGNHSIVATYVGGKEHHGDDPTTDGAMINWFIKYLREYGSLLSKKYGPDNLESWDRATYKRYGNGLSNNLKLRSKLYPLMHAEKVSSYNEARDAIAAGYTPIIGSTMGVHGAKKDKNGFFYPKGYTPHAMACIGMEDKERPSILIQNSHGPTWAPGPKRYGFEPEGSAWVDADIFNKYIGQYNDSWVMSMFKGYDVKRKYILW